MMPANCPVRLSLQDYQVSAQVRFCRPEGPGSFIVGMQILDFVRPSETPASNETASDAAARQTSPAKP